MVLLETRRLRLRRFTLDDVDRLVELDSDPEVMRNITPDRFDAGEQELGYRLRRASWGRGLATEGAAALVEHGFARVGAEKISARALAANRGSRAVMEKCGLRHERDFSFPEDVLAGRSAEERVAVKYSITRSRWQAALA